MVTKLYWKPDSSGIGCSGLVGANEDEWAIARRFRLSGGIGRDLLIFNPSEQIVAIDNSKLSKQSEIL
ncbi:MAG: hypothetical protein AAGK78_04440, partial [Planctomycetota bacterium]